MSAAWWIHISWSLRSCGWRSETAQTRRSLSEFVSRHDCPLGLVINNDERTRRLIERILAIPAASL